MSELVSIVVAMYNSSKFIQNTLDCLLSQTYEPIEIILVDDGSSDETLALVKSLTSTINNVRCYKKANGGVASARNYGIEQATGHYIAFCDHDDQWWSKKLDCQMRLFAEDARVGLIYSQARVIDEQGRILKERIPDTPYEGDVLNELLCYNFIPFSSAVVRKSCLDLLGGFREMHGSDDRNLWIRLATQFKIRCCKEVLFDYVKHGQNYSDQEVEMLEAGLRCLDDIWACFPEIKARDTSLFWKSYGELYRNYGITFFTQSDYGRARSCLLAAARAEPWRASTYKYLLLSLMPKQFVGGAKAVRKKMLRLVNCQRN